jgi:hypothetical protein
MEIINMKHPCVKVLDSKYGGIRSRVSFAIITLVVIGSVLFLFLENQRKLNKYNYEKAIMISEYGFQQAMQQAYKQLNSNETIEGIEKTEYDEGWYEVDMSSSRKDSILTLIVRSKGMCGKQSVVKEESIPLIRSFKDNDSVWILKQDE